MSEDVRHSGEIHIDPPIDWEQIKDSSFLPHRLQTSIDGNDKDVELVVEEQPIPGGFTRRATAIRSLDLGGYSGYHVVEHVQELVDAYGDGRTFTGWIECVGREGDQWRIEVRDGQAVRVEPRVIWPGESEDRQLHEENERLQTSLDAIAGTAKRAVASMTHVLDLVAADDAPDVRAALEVATAPTVPAEVFDRIQAGSARATELRYVERRLAEATGRLARIKDVHAQLVSETHLHRAVELLAEAWHGHEPADPYAPLEEPADSRTGAERLRDIAGEVTGS